MNGKRVRLIRRYARVANKDAEQIKKSWNVLARDIPSGTKSKGEPEEAKRSYAAEMRRAVAASDDD